MRKLSIALALAAMSIHSTVASSRNLALVARQKQIDGPVQGMMPKQKAQFGKPPRKLHNRGIGMGSGRKNR